MTGNITWETVLGLIALAGVISGIWFRLEGKIKLAQDSASLPGTAAQTTANSTQTDLLSFKLYCAETFATKGGVDKTFEIVAKSIIDVGARMEQRLDGMNERLDRVIEASKTAARVNLL